MVADGNHNSQITRMDIIFFIELKISKIQKRTTVET